VLTSEVIYIDLWRENAKAEFSRKTVNVIFIGGGEVPGMTVRGHFMLGGIHNS
jgi:hypothetical protein